MGWANKLIGWATGNGVEVNSSNEMKVVTDSNRSTVRFFSENDQGLAWGLGNNLPYSLSPETSDEYRLRVEHDIVLDEEAFVYVAQNFTKHQLAATTYVPSFTATGFSTNPTNLLTAAAAVSLRTYKTFSVVGTETLSLDLEANFTFASGTQLPANTVIEFGLGLAATAAPYDFFDSTYFRLTPSGGYLVIRNNSSTDTSISGLLLAPDGTGTTVWQPVSGRKYQFILYLMTRSVELWISDPVTGLTWLAGELSTPPGYGAPVSSPAVQFTARQYQATAPTVASQITLGRYCVRRGGQLIATGLGDFETRAAESIYSLGTLTTTAANTVTAGSVTRPAAAALSNTTALITGLSGIALETATLAVGTDGILMAYQNPVLPTAPGTSYAQQRRLGIRGIRVGSSVQAAFTAGGFAKHFYLAYGSTSLSLAGVAADTATTKAYRRVMLELMQAYAATAAAGTLPSQNGPGYIPLSSAVYINPGEWVALVNYHIGTAGVTGVIQHNLAFDFFWE